MLILPPQMLLYMALAPKSDSAIRSIDEALSHVREAASLRVPGHLRDRANRSEGPEGEVYRSPHRHAEPTTDYLGAPLEFYRPAANDQRGNASE